MHNRPRTSPLQDPPIDRRRVKQSLLTAMIRYRSGWVTTAAKGTIPRHKSRHRKPCWRYGLEPCWVSARSFEYLQLVSLSTIRRQFRIECPCISTDHNVSTILLIADIPSADKSFSSSVIILAMASKIFSRPSHDHYHVTTAVNLLARPFLARHRRENRYE